MLGQVGTTAEACRLRGAISDLTPDKLILQEAARGDFRAPHGVDAASTMYERRWICPSGACVAFSQHSSTQRKTPCGAENELALTEDMVGLAKQYGRYGYDRVTALLHAAHHLRRSSFEKRRCRNLCFTLGIRRIANLTMEDGAGGRG